MSKLFGDKLRQLREAGGLSQQELARRLGYASNSYIGDVESGLFVPSEERLAALSRALGVQPGVFHEAAFESKLAELGITEPAFVGMFKDYPKLSPRDKRAILAAYREAHRRRDATRRR